MWGRGEEGLWEWGYCVWASCSAASRLEHSQIQAQPHSYLFHKLRSKCRCWQIRPGSGTALLQQLLSRNSPSMPCWGWGKELKDSWAGCVINSLHDWCPTWLIMSQLKKRQENGKYFQTHRFLFIFTLPETDCKRAFCLSLFCKSFHSCLVSSTGLAWHLGRERVMKSLIRFLDPGVALWVAWQLQYYSLMLPFCQSQRVFSLVE